MTARFSSRTAARRRRQEERQTLAVCDGCDESTPVLGLQRSERVGRAMLCAACKQAEREDIDAENEREDDTRDLEVDDRANCGGPRYGI